MPNFISTTATPTRAAKLHDAPSTTSSASLLATLVSSSSSVPGRSGSATVVGDHVTAALKPAPQEGDIYINKDGKKVRRIKRTVVNPPSFDTAEAPKPVPVTLSTSTAKSLHDLFSGSATVAGDEYGGDIYINKDGKKVRRIKRTAVEPPSFDTAEAPIEGEVLIRADGKKVCKTAECEGEICIRADGKKVRRVYKNAAGAPALAAIAAPKTSLGLRRSTNQQNCQRHQAQQLHRLTEKTPYQIMPTLTTAATQVESNDMNIRADAQSPLSKRTRR